MALMYWLDLQWVRLPLGSASDCIIHHFQAVRGAHGGRGVTKQRLEVEIRKIARGIVCSFKQTFA